MAKKKNQDTAKAKAAKQKKLAIGGGVLLVLLLAIQVPRMMKMMNPQPKPPIVNGAVATPTTPGATPSATPATVTPADPNSLAAPTLGGAPTATPAATSELVSAVPVTADPGQLESFNKFASKDPFATQVTSAAAGAQSGADASPGGSKSGSDGGTVSLPTITVPSSGGSSGSGGSSKPPVAAPTTAVISLNGELLAVPAGTDFPLSGVVFDRLGAPLFHLVSISAKSAKIAIVGGKYADGSPAITLQLKKALTLQNTADGTKYTLILQPPDTAVAGAATTPATTTPSTPVVPPSGSGG
jgi:hypothetical protein